jgi:hypothetical protein
MEAMSGGLAFAGFEGAGLASDLFGVVRIVNILSGVCSVYAGLPALVALHFQFRISGKSSPCLSM